ncbi:hypothetical protein LXA47_32410 [Massilia sp. P8910]|uniref:hypothetical protein n=1 Tax=Massilia antarctica TaxID=2765360 RepID=UPI001E64DF3F|nr:hypothetical protein [Massilia antarctica]MCE3608273.1 hypothetical protein [Massilia antarctica]
MNLRLSSAALVASIAILTGCMTPPQTPVALAPQAFVAPANNYGVFMTTLPVVDTQFPGADCLLCMAAASMMNSSLTSHVKTLPYEELPQLPAQVATVLKQRGANVTMIEKLDFAALPDNGKAAPGFSRKDMSGLKASHKIDKLLVINLSMVGVERTFASYIPTSDPKAKVAGAAYIVNLTDNSYEWYVPLNVQKAADGKWDEPPTFPGVSNAYFQVLEMTKDQIIKPLSN